LSNIKKIIEDGILDDMERIDGQPYAPVARLIELGRKKTYVTIDDILNFFPEAERDVDQLEEAFAALLSAGIPYIDDDTTIEPTDESLIAEQEEAEEEAQKDDLEIEENYLANIDTDDMIGLYLKEVGRVPLLTAEEEVHLAKRIENGRISRETLAKDGKTSQALYLLYGGLNSARSSRDRFMWQIWFCRFLAQTKQARLSASHCRQLVDWVDRYRLEEWDPLLATEAFVTVLSSARIQGPDKDETVYGGILRRLQLLDPGRALMFEVD